MSRTRVEAAIEKMKFARRYSNQFLEGLTPEEWFWQPAEGVTHIAWQVAHLAAAQYGLCIARRRGPIEFDREFIADDFLPRYALASTPEADPAKNLSVEEIQRIHTGVFDLTMSELADLTDAELDVPCDKPHPVFKTKLGGIEYSADHEMIHAGQMALLRRLMGKPAIR